MAIATWWSRVRFPAAATNTRMGDCLRAGKPPQYLTKPPRPTQPPTLSGAGNKYQLKWGAALQLGCTGRYGSFHLWINVWVAGKTVWFLVNTCHTWALKRWAAHNKALYRNKASLAFFLYTRRYEESNKRFSYRKGTAQRAIKVEILSTAAQLYEKVAFQKAFIRCVTLKVTQGHRNCTVSVM